tara:strand:- start:394 stop:645 length:252 start_codon:yes stop_codon:yes gene_type:complete
MCIFSAPTPTPAGAPPPVAPRQNTDTSLPKARTTKDSEQKAAVQFGNTKKDRGSAEANRTGTDALKINLNEDEKGSTTGGLNV